MTPLRAAGLTTTETKCYEALLGMPDCKPSELARIVNESRTNCYKILDKLCEYNLAERFEKGKIIYYQATNPTQLLQLARERRLAQQQAERELELKVQDMVATYTKTHDQPGVRYFFGKDEIKSIYEDQVAEGSDIRFMHTIAGIDFYGYEHMHLLRMMAVNAGLQRHAITPDTKLAHANYKETDKQFLLERTWMQETDYTAPVEWGVYGKKLYIISFGEEAMGMIIESAQIAAAFTQVYKLLDRGLKDEPWYADLPHLAQKQAQSGPARKK